MQGEHHKVLHGIQKFSRLHELNRLDNLKMSILEFFNIDLVYAFTCAIWKILIYIHAHVFHSLSIRAQCMANTTRAQWRGNTMRYCMQFETFYNFVLMIIFSFNFKTLKLNFKVQNIMSICNYTCCVGQPWFIWEHEEVDRSYISTRLSKLMQIFIWKYFNVIFTFIMI